MRDGTVLDTPSLYCYVQAPWLLANTSFTVLLNPTLIDSTQSFVLWPGFVHCHCVKYSVMCGVSAEMKSIPSSVNFDFKYLFNTHMGAAGVGGSGGAWGVRRQATYRETTVIFYGCLLWNPTRVRSVFLAE